MPDQVVQFEGTEHHFPDDFSQQDIAKALSIAHPMPPSTYIGRLMANIPSSLMNTLASTASAYSGGGGLNQPDTIAPIAPGEDPNAPFYGFRQTGKAVSDALSKVRHPFMALQEDPIGTVANIGQLASGATGGVEPPGATGPVIGGALKGAYEDITGPPKYHFRGIPVPAAISTGAGAGYLAGGHEGALVGAGLGAAASGVRGAIKGAKQGLADYRYSQIPKTANAVAPVDIPAPPPFDPIQSSLPSGRVPGGIFNQKPIPPGLAPPEVETSAPPEVKPPAVLGKAGGFSKLSPEHQAVALKAMGIEIPSTETPAAASPKFESPLPQTEQERLLQFAEAHRTTKNVAIAQYFAKQGITPEQIANMSDAEYDSHVRQVKSPLTGNNYQPSTGKNYSRQKGDARQQVIDMVKGSSPTPFNPRPIPPP